MGRIRKEQGKHKEFMREKLEEKNWEKYGNKQENTYGNN